MAQLNISCRKQVEDIIDILLNGTFSWVTKEENDSVSGKLDAHSFGFMIQIGKMYNKKCYMWIVDDKSKDYTYFTDNDLPNIKKLCEKVLPKIAEYGSLKWKLLRYIDTFQKEQHR